MSKLRGSFTRCLSELVYDAGYGVKRLGTQWRQAMRDDRGAVEDAIERLAIEFRYRPLQTLDDCFCVDGGSVRDLSRAIPPRAHDLGKRKDVRCPVHPSFSCKPCIFRWDLGNRVRARRDSISREHVPDLRISLRFRLLLRQFPPLLPEET